MLRKKRSPTHPSARKVSCKNLGKSLKSLKFNSPRSCTFVFIEVAGFNVDGIFIEDTQFLTPQTLFFSSEHIVGDASNNDKLHGMNGYNQITDRINAYIESIVFTAPIKRKSKTFLQTL